MMYPTKLSSVTKVKWYSVIRWLLDIFEGWSDKKNLGKKARSTSKPIYTYTYIPMNFVFQLSLGQKFNQQKINSVIKKKIMRKNLFDLKNYAKDLFWTNISYIISYQRLFRHQIFSLGFPTQLFSDYFEIVLHWFFCPTYIIMILFANALCIFSQFSEKWRPILKQILTFLLCVCFFLQFFNTLNLKSKKKIAI